MCLWAKVPFGCCQLVDAMTAGPHRCLFVRGIPTDFTPGPGQAGACGRPSCGASGVEQRDHEGAPLSPRQSHDGPQGPRDAQTALGRTSPFLTGMVLRAAEEKTWAKLRRDRGGHQTSGASGEHAGRLTIRGTVRASGRDTGTCASLRGQHTARTQPAQLCAACRSTGSTIPGVCC